MPRFNKHLAAAALIAAIGAAGTALAQTAYTDDPQDTPQTSADTEHGYHILHFKDQGNSPETDPAAHLLLIKDVRPMQAALVTTTQQTTTVADATPAPVPVDTAPAATSTDTNSATTTTDTTSSTDAAPMPAPRADRN